MFKSILENYGMKDAKNIVLSGLSAGGMAAMYWADYLGTLIDKTKTNYIVAPDSGYISSHMKHHLLKFNIADTYLIYY